MNSYLSIAPTQPSVFSLSLSFFSRTQHTALSDSDSTYQYAFSALMNLQLSRTRSTLINVIPSCCAIPEQYKPLEKIDQLFLHDALMVSYNIHFFIKFHFIYFKMRPVWVEDMSNIVLNRYQVNIFSYHSTHTQKVEFIITLFTQPSRLPHYANFFCCVV